MFNFLKKKKNEVNLVFNGDEINTICLILYRELKRLEPRITLDKKDSNTYIKTKRYYNLLNEKEVAVIPVCEKDHEDLLWLTVLLMCEADKTADQTEKSWIYSIAARIQFVHKRLGM